jgi:hypothetical protein
MTHGKISLKALHEYAKQHPYGPPHRSKRDDRNIYRPYRERVCDLIRKVTETDGWYVWFDSKGRTATYIGQTANRQTSCLRQRLYDELTEELVAIWCHAKTKTDADKIAEIYSKKYKRKYNQARAAKKKDADTILWISYPGVNYETLDVVEDKLIERFKPKANVRIQRNVDWSAYESVLEIVKKNCV